MTDAGRSAVVVLSLLFAALLFHRALAATPVLGPPRAVPKCEVAVEMVGEGVRCLEDEQARRSGVAAGDRVALVEVGRVARLSKIGRMAPARLELFAVPLDVNAAPVEELASLPGVGPKLAERMVAARPFSNIQDVGRVKGVGERRLETLLPRLRLGVTAPVPLFDGGAAP